MHLSLTWGFGPAWVSGELHAGWIELLVVYFLWKSATGNPELPDAVWDLFQVGLQGWTSFLRTVFR